MDSISYFKLLEENRQLKEELANLKASMSVQGIPLERFDEYEVVNKEIESSREVRINWKKVLGETLTKITAEQYAKGRTPVEAYELIKQRLISEGYNNDELLRKLKIGVCARFGEIRSEHSKINEVTNRKLRL